MVEKSCYMQLTGSVVSNAKIIYKELNPHKKIKPKEFRLNVIHGLLDGYEPPYMPFKRPSSNPELRLAGGHILH